MYSAYEYAVNARDNLLVKTDISIGLPKSSYGRIAPRSGIALKQFIGIGAGVVNRDYEGKSWRGYF